MEIQEIHEQLLQLALEHREKNSQFTFSSRKKNDAKGRMAAGYWFRGNPSYVFFSPYRQSDSKSKTQTIGFVVIFRKGKISGISYQITFDAEENRKNKEFYHRVLQLLDEPVIENKYRYTIKIDPRESLETLFLRFLEGIVPQVNSLISEFSLDDQFFVPEEDYSELQKKISKVKKRGLASVIENKMSDENDYIGDEETSFWIFQGNPTMFDVEKYLSVKNQIVWRVSRYKNEISIGDSVLIWVSGENSGVYAECKVTEAPSTTIIEDAQNLWNDNIQSTGKEVRCRLSIQRKFVNNPILRTAIKKNDWANEVSIISNPQGTNFRISQEHYKQILALYKEVQADKNLIFYGPPGVGKTYNTINKALELCGDDLTGLNRSDIKDRFEQKVDEGRIIFTTFHQSMTYEDFVEGIKPTVPKKEGDPVVYRVEEGIFRKLCIEASFSLAKERESVATENVLDFSSAFDNFVQEIEEKLASETTIELVTKNGGKVVVDGISQQGNILIKHSRKDNTYPVSKQRLSKLHAAFPALEDVSNIVQQFRSIIGGSNSTVNWAVLNAIRSNNHLSAEAKQEVKKYSWDDKMQVVKSFKKEDYKGYIGQPYILIIDEINRGNVSQIFGELITLIEEDKRLGNPESIQVRLPYSKEWFGVPSNIHIIGTMNTADRSVEALDTALRRRFSFIEMPPKPELVKTEGKTKNGIVNGIDLCILLGTINKRIEKLLDKDHMIGHSYFLSIENIGDLKSAFQNKIIPLLQEYFFGDYGKIGLVIGSKFFEIKDNQADENFFAPFEDYDSSPLVERKVYHIKKILEMSDELFVKALNELQRISS